MKPERFEQHSHRLDIHVHVVGSSQLDSIHAKLDQIINKENQDMAIGEDILAKVTEADTKVDSVIALLNGLTAAGTITPEVRDAIFAKIQGSEDKLDAAIAANTTPPTP